MKRALLIAGGLLAVLAGVLVLWLGPGALAWTARAAIAPASSATAWSHVPADAPGIASAHLPRLLESRVGLGLRPELEALAALRGADLSWFQERLEEVLVVYDGNETAYAVGRRLALSPDLIVRFDERWGPIEGAGHRGASDGLLALFPLEPGIVLATEGSAAGRAMQLATAAGADSPLLALDEPGLALAARVEITPALRVQLRRRADPRALPLVESLKQAELELTALDELEALLVLECRDERSAQGTEQLLRQIDFAARASRQAGGLAAALLGDAGRILGELPPLEIGRDGETVSVRARAGAEEIRPWLRRALDALASRS